jgi:hypothetical protein
MKGMGTPDFRGRGIARGRGGYGPNGTLRTPGTLRIRKRSEPIETPCVSCTCRKCRKCLAPVPPYLVGSVWHRYAGTGTPVQPRFSRPMDTMAAVDTGGKSMQATGQEPSAEIRPIG